MRTPRLNRAKIAERINVLVSGETPLREIAGNLSKVARYAIDEANSLSVERVEITLPRLPKKLDRFRILHLSDTHHSPFTDLKHIARAVAVASEFEPDIVALTGDYVSHEAKYISPVAKVLGELRGKYGVFACLGNHDHWTDAAAMTRHLEKHDIRVLVNEGIRIDANGAPFWLAGVDDHMVGRTDLPAAMKGSFPDEFKL
ncbi:MAG: metallophosphoesterase, partial [Blastocatellia bacterium]|nr:metallophosphoesterase [Blastocatellia bacterium]